MCHPRNNRYYRSTFGGGGGGGRAVRGVAGGLDRSPLRAD